MQTTKVKIKKVRESATGFTHKPSHEFGNQPRPTFDSTKKLLDHLFLLTNRFGPQVTKCHIPIIYAVRHSLDGSLVISNEQWDYLLKSSDLSKTDDNNWTQLTVKLIT